MAIRLFYAMLRVLIEHRGRARLFDAPVMHWVAVFILVIGQFTAFPMLAIIAANTHGHARHAVNTVDGLATSNITIAFKNRPARDVRHGTPLMIPPQFQR